MLASPPNAQAAAPLLDLTWRGYLDQMVQGDGRVIDRKAGHITTSEGQAYALLRAVWVNDRPSFDRLLRWTRDNLQGNDPTALPAWKWAQREDGSWGVVDPNSATDADLWMAYALVLAAETWGERAYRDQARALLQHIWDAETRQLGDRRVVLPGPWAQGQDPVSVNPSYWLPFAYRAFASVDPAHDWLGLVDSTYQLLLELRGERGLTPDWAWLDATTGRPVAPPDPSDTRSQISGYEAFRLTWTLAAEARWYADPRALAELSHQSWTADRLDSEGVLPGVIPLSGGTLGGDPYLGRYGALLPALDLMRPGAATRLYGRAIAPVTTPRGWGDADDYYAQNWVWLGMALWTGVARPPVEDQ